MDVGLLASHISFDRHGGANYSKHVLGQQLEARGHSATYYTFNLQDDNHIPVEHDYDVVGMELGARGYLDGGPKFVKWIARRLDMHDVFHVYIPGPIPLVVLARDLYGSDTPVVTTLNGYTPFCSNSSMMADGCWEDCTLSKKLMHGKRRAQNAGGLRSMSRYAFNDVATVPLMNRADGHMCLSPAVAEVYEGVGVDGSLLDVIPNMVDPEFSAPEAAADGGEAGPVRLLYAGRLDPGKGVSGLLEAVAEMEPQADFELSVVGDDILGYSENGLQGYVDMARELGVGDVVSFEGWVDYHDLPEHYARADAFVHPGVWPEPFGRTIIEAMEHGLPVICSNVGAPPWVAGSAGVTFEKESPLAMARAMEAVVDSPERRDALSANAGLELERFEPGRVTDRVVEYYRGAGA